MTVDPARLRALLADAKMPWPSDHLDAELDVIRATYPSDLTLAVEAVNALPDLLDRLGELEATEAASLRVVEAGEEMAAIFNDVNALAEAAEAEVARLTAENGRLREALRPFADAAENWRFVAEVETIERIGDESDRPITVGDLRRAAAALNEGDATDG